ncbi:MAG: HAD family hydrolase [Clostridia bacterium]|nr:HAD family hydrolase [Clostridia bacterium]
MKYTHYLWDFDGTLFDSYPHVLASLEKVLAEEGISCDHTELWRRLLVNYGEGRKYAGISPEAYKRFVDYQYIMDENEIEPKVIPFEGMRELLADIVKNGGKNYLYTHRNKTAVAFLDRFGMTEFFADFVSSEEHFPAKPAPDAVLAIIERNHLDPEDCVMVGDRLIDGMAGINAGIAGALITAATDNTKTPDNDYDAIALETSLVSSVAHVTRETMTHIVRDLAEFRTEMDILG